MKAIIYLSESAAIEANESLSDLNHKPVTYAGSGPHVHPEEKPYSNIIKHPYKEEWALASTTEIDQFLNEKSIELTSDWFEEL